MYFEKIELGTPWSKQKRLHWYFNQIAKGPTRDYQADIVLPMQQLANKNNFELIQYGQLTINGPRYPLLAMIAGDLSNGKPTKFISSGNHGYEPSGIIANKEFLENEAESYIGQLNIVAPICISPWSYEYDHRWNAFAEDTNRCFSLMNSPYTDETAYLMRFINRLNVKFHTAIDLHETPLRDIELRKSRASRFGTELESYWREVPQGYYQMLTKSDDETIMHQRNILAKSITQAVGDISPIAPEPNLLGYDNDSGTVWAPNKGATLRVFLEGYAHHTIISEVFPDHKEVGTTIAVEIQKQAIRSSLKFI